MNTVKIVVWQDDDAWLGYLQEYPEHLARHIIRMMRNNDLDQDG